LQLPHIKPQDNFGGLLSADRIKQFAFSASSRNVSANWEDSTDGELVTMKSQTFQEEDPQEKTIRPNWKLPPAKSRKLSVPDLQPRRKSASAPRKQAVGSHERQRSEGKNSGTKFELPSRPDALAYREQTIEDYSDLFGDDDQDDFAFSQRLSQMKKVCDI
jgi:hypothetical protein